MTTQMRNKTIHFVLRLLAAASAAILSLASLFEPFYRLLVRTRLDQAAQMWLLASPAILARLIPAWRYDKRMHRACA